ncbi:hypothetical protein J6590_033114 [Homalodisca vitripennis]|nr:hypothetical protein J6590_033114 [Homalodisca vitripennis]
MVGVRGAVVTWLQLALLIWMLTCSITRVTDHRHHWWDVLAGCVLGALLGVYTIHYFCSNFKTGNYKSLNAPKPPDKERRSFTAADLVLRADDTAS